MYSRLFLVVAGGGQGSGWTAGRGEATKRGVREEAKEPNNCRTIIILKSIQRKLMKYLLI